MVEDRFADKAGDWDRRERVRRLSEDVAAAILARTALHPDMAVMDFGAGTGLVSAWLAPRVGRLVAVDTSAAMLERLAAKPELAERVETVCRDITAEPLGERFDLIVSAMALHHVADTALLLARLAAHLRPGGAVALADLDTEDGTFHPPGTEGVYHHGFERQALAGQMEAAGLEGVRFTTAHTVAGEDRDYPVFLATARLA